MNFHLRLVLSIGLLLVLVYLIRQVKNKKLLLQYTLSWMFLLLALWLLVLFPDLLVIFSKLLGIAVPMNTLFFLGFCFALVIIYRLTVAVSKMSEEITKLTQEVALLKDKSKSTESDAQ